MRHPKTDAAPAKGIGGTSMDRDRILIVDDEELNRDILADILCDYDTLQASNGMEALEIIGKNPGMINAVLLDLVMPGLDGYETLKALQERGYLEHLPIIIITGDDSVGTEKKCFEVGASDYIRKPFDESLVIHRIKNIIQLYDYKKSLEDKVAQQTSKLNLQYKLLQDSAEILKRNNKKIIEILGTIVEYRNLESGEHVRRVMEYTEILGTQLMKDCPEYELSPETIRTISEASALHDIGKITIPDSILLKPGKLTDEEFDYMKSHTIRGCEILKSIEGIWDKTYSKYSYEICRYHHERYNGKGYPDGLAGDKIPIAAQIVSLADVYDALINERCYKDAYPKDEAFLMIMEGECGVFNPKLLQAFRECREQFENSFTEGDNLHDERN